MENEKTLNALLKLTLNYHFQSLKKAQNKFVAMHYANAHLIGSKGFTNLMGKSYSMDIIEFEDMLKTLSSVSDAGAEIVFDYFQTLSYKQIEKTMSRCGYLIYEHLSSDEMEKLGAPAGFYFVLAVKKEHIIN